MHIMQVNRNCRWEVSGSHHLAPQVRIHPEEPLEKRLEVWVHSHLWLLSVPPCSKERTGKVRHRKYIWGCWAKCLSHWLTLHFSEMQDGCSLDTYKCKDLCVEVLIRRECLHYLPVNASLFLWGRALAPGFYNLVQNISTITKLLQK